MTGWAVEVAGQPVFRCPSDEKLLLAMERQGVHAIPVGCRGGGCGICRIRVKQGRYRAAKMSRSRISAAEEAAGYALACRVYPLSDLVVEA